MRLQPCIICAKKLANIAQMCTKCVKMDVWHDFRYHILWGHQPEPKGLKPNLTIFVHWFQNIVRCQMWETIMVGFGRRRIKYMLRQYIKHPLSDLSFWSFLQMTFEDIQTKLEVPPANSEEFWRKSTQQSDKF